MYWYNDCRLPFTQSSTKNSNHSNHSNYSNHSNCSNCQESVHLYRVSRTRPRLQELPREIQATQFFLDLQGSTQSQATENYCRRCQGRCQGRNKQQETRKTTCNNFQTAHGYERSQQKISEQESNEESWESSNKEESEEGSQQTQTTCDSLRVLLQCQS